MGREDPIEFYNLWFIVFNFFSNNISSLISLIFSNCIIINIQFIYKRYTCYIWIEKDVHFTM